MGIFKKISEALRKTREAFRRKLDAIYSGGELTDEFYDDLTDILISCDIGAQTSMNIVEELRNYSRKNKIHSAEEVRKSLKNILVDILNENEKIEFTTPAIITIIGVNGVGKTTTIGKLANYFKKQKKSVTLVAGDTFRAAASAQLNEWAERNKVKIVKHQEGADAAAVVYDGIASAKAKQTDVVIVDTAGRLQTKTNLMEELRKIDKIITKEGSDFNQYTLIVLDATTGQNALSQINSFNNYSEIDGIILTKLDGTAKGGVVLSIAKEYGVPVCFLGTGETIDDLEEFNSTDFVDNLL